MELTWRSLWIVTVILSAIISAAHSYTITVDAHAEECFFETVEADTKMGLTFEIAEGGFLDIDVTITNPEGAVIYKGERESSGLYTFSATTSGKYTYCFSNKMSTMTPKVVMFNLEVGEAQHKSQDPDVDHNKLEDMIKELATTLKTVKHEQEYMQIQLTETKFYNTIGGLIAISDFFQTFGWTKYLLRTEVRDRIHREINESTNSRVVMWSIFEASVLLIMTFGQVYYLKRFFEVQRVV